MTSRGLFTDFYELTMAQGYWKRDMNRPAVFDMFFRRQPFCGGFSILAGIEPTLSAIEDFRFSADDLAYLDSLNMFEEKFLEYLENFRFTGDVWAIDEGSVIFPNEPLVRVSAGLIEAQLLEGLILNAVNFQSLIATKTARVWLASNKGSIMEFGLRRAQGRDGALSASRAAYIGGAASTSNTLAGKLYGIPVSGTMAHSWIMSFPTEEEAFDAYAEIYPDKTVFLIDTYDTLKSGVKSAIAAGKRLTARGKKFGVRLDSGDIQYLSAQVRSELDKAGLRDATITVSNELSETIIETLMLHNAPVDSWGVGTHMVTGGDESSFTGVYKLAARNEENGLTAPVMKFSDNPEKTTNPGVKQVWRVFDGDGMAKADVIALNDETVPAGIKQTFYHPAVDYRSFSFEPAAAEPLLKERIRAGKRTAPEVSLAEIRAFMRSSLERFDDSYKRFLNPHIYKVSTTEKLKDLKLSFLEQR